MPLVAENMIVVHFIVLWVEGNEETNNTHTRNAYARRWGFQGNIILKRIYSDNINTLHY